MKSLEGQYLTFLLKSETYGIPIGCVREINRVGEITPVPRTPEFIKGVFNLRGKIIPVINLREKLGIKAIPFDRDTCTIVVETEGGQIGCIVDAVKEVVTLSENQVEPPPQFGQGGSQSVLIGLGKTPQSIIILIDISKAFSIENMEQVTQLQDVQKEAA
jgi:purine-binding chemotaxis protein CheW